MNKIAVIGIPIIFLASCTTPSPIEVNRDFSDIGNFHFNTGNTDIEFVKDSNEFVRFVGYADSDPTNMFVVEEKDYWSPPVRFLDIKGSTYLQNHIILDKIEVHYKHIHHLDFGTYQPPTNLGVYLDRDIYTREPIVEDSLEIILRDKHRSFIEVNTTYLSLTGRPDQIRIKGEAQHFEAGFYPGYNNNSSPLLDFSELHADSCFLKLSNWGGGYNPYIRIDVYANDYLFIDLQPIVGTCMSCVCEVYYKGHPTIVNYDELDSRIIVIDNN